MNNQAGVPLGGIGAGKIEYCADGAFRNITIQNNPCNPISAPDVTATYSPAGVSGCFFGHFVEGKGAYCLKVEEPTVTRCIEQKDIGFEGLFPVARVAFRHLPDAEVSLIAYSGLNLLDPGSSDCRDSSLPVVYFKFTLRNLADLPRFMSVLFSWRNTIGAGGPANCMVRDLRGNAIRPIEIDRGLALEHYSTIRKVCPDVDGNLIQLAISRDGCHHTHMTHPSRQINTASRRTMWQHFEEDGLLPDSAIVADPADPHRFGALAVGRRLAAGEDMTAVFALAWHFPDRSVVNRHGYRNKYTAWFDSAIDVAHHAISRWDATLEMTTASQDLLRESSLPDWLVRRVINGLFPLYGNTIYLVDGRFSCFESPADMAGCLGTIDQRNVSSGVLAACFPPLARAELELFMHQQITPNDPARFGFHWTLRTGRLDLKLDRVGAIRHDVGWGDLEGGWTGNEHWLTLHWPDLTCAFVLQCYEYVASSGDKAFLERAYPSMVAALKFLHRLDQDGDGIADLWGAGSCSYDSSAFPWFGASPYIATLQLAALAALQRLAAKLGDHSTVRYARDCMDRMGDSIQDKLWDPDLHTYRNWVDTLYEGTIETERRHESHSEACGVGQLAGKWFADKLDLEIPLPDSQIKQITQTVWRHNVKPYRGCPANETVAGDRPKESWPYYAECYHALVALQQNQVTLGMDTLRRISATLDAEGNNPWDAPLSFEGPDLADPGWGRQYMSNMSAWNVLLALSGCWYDSVDYRLRLTPASPDVESSPGMFPVLLPRFRATVNLLDATVTIHLVRLHGSDTLSVRSLTVRSGICAVAHNGNRVPAALVKEVGELRHLSVDLVLKEGDELTVR